MTEFNKLADVLANQGQCDEHGTNCIVSRQAADEAIAILRAAASVDVAGLMELAAKAIYDQWADQLGWVEWVPGGNSLNQDEARSIARAALESALRMALAASPEDQIIELAQALEQRRALAITDAVHNLPVGGRTANMPTAFQAGYCAACEEIEHRLRTEEWTHCLKPVGAAAPKGTP